MKKTITKMALALSIYGANAQVVVTDFETFTLSANSAYSPTTSTPFQTNNVSFQYKWDSGFNYWSGGFSYTNKYDSITAGATNLYGVRPFKGFNNSAIYVVGQDRGVINIAASQATVNGFYITNTTYAYKAMAKGNAFSRKFGDTTGTGSGTTIPQGSYPDYFKVIAKGYNNGVLKNDSVTVYLANFTFTNNTQDFILDTWQFVNTSAIGEVDSLQFFMRSSDVGQFGINTPLFFGMDNFTTKVPNFVGLMENQNNLEWNIYPNPCHSALVIATGSQTESPVKVIVSDINGKVVYSNEVSAQETSVDFNNLASGIYFLEMTSANQKTIKKIIKN